MEKFKITEKARANIKNTIRGHISLRGKTLKDVALLLNKYHDRSPNPNSLADRVRTGLIRYAEVLEIADVLGYKLEWVEKDEK
ncbi:MAG: hypothetical protein LBJ74_00865 [Heliobacteriaceae bacterium]|jgi:hypothetical protein|nr:hypothetical protein [Heliobacteriaceae bacterium]